ncbi:12735_t:CDS:2 [Entrophospora sp. SA101]|nr:12735_t:CDS:2 [Entrophospora sp. SA101]
MREISATKIERDNSDSVNFEDFEEMYPYFDEKPENNSESLFQLLTDNMKNYKVKRPLAYNENSKSIQKTSAKENIQTLDIFLSRVICGSTNEILTLQELMELLKGLLRLSKLIGGTLKLLKTFKASILLELS